MGPRWTGLAAVSVILLKVSIHINEWKHSGFLTQTITRGQHLVSISQIRVECDGHVDPVNQV